MAKKLQTDGNLLHHDHQHPHQPNAHTNMISTHLSDNSTTRTEHDGNKNLRESIDYIPPEISLDDHHESDDVCFELTSFLFE